MDNIIKRWEKISVKGKKYHMYFGASLYRNVPLMIVILIIMELFNQYRSIDFKLLMVNFTVKTIFAYFIGVYTGHLEWNFLENIMQRRYQSNKTLRFDYVYTYGVVMFGTTMMLAMVDPFFTSNLRMIIGIITNLIAGLFWGGLMSATINRDILSQ